MSVVSHPIPTPNQAPAPRVIWSVALGEPPAGPPALIGETVLVLTQGSRRATGGATASWFGLANGRQISQRALEAILISGVAAVPPQTSQATAEMPDERGEVSALVATYSANSWGGKGMLLAFDESGNERWRWSPDVQGISAPALLDQTVWITTNTRTLCALDLMTGAQQAQIPLETTPSLSAPILVDQVAYIPCRGPTLLAVGLDGQNRWKFEAPEAGSWLDKTPLIVGERLFGVLNLTGGVISLKVKDGQPLWQVSLGPKGKPLSPPATDGERLYVGTRAGLHALSPVDGSEIWHYPRNRGLEAAPVVLDGLVYIACRDHNLYALDAEDGQLLWQYQAGRRIEVAPLITAGSPPVALIADRGGTITAVKRPISIEKAVPVRRQVAQLKANLAAIGERKKDLAANKPPESEIIAIRDLFRKAFDDEKLATLCFDHFRPVYRKFTAKTKRLAKIQLLLEYCEQRNRFGALLTLVEQEDKTK